MTRKSRPKKDARLDEVPEALLSKVRAPVGILFGSPGEVINLHEQLEIPDLLCFQMDLFPAERLRESFTESVRVVTHPDLWDVDEEFQTLIYLPERKGERELKIDVIEQAFHLLKPKGRLIVWSAYPADDFFPPLLKKVFGKASIFPQESGTVLISQRDKDRSRRRHEMTYQARLGQGESCRFVSRPGIFSYGRFDNGARAMMEVADIREGDSVLDLGCGCGTNGVFAWQRTGEKGHIAFLDSNVRATALAEMNAKANGVANFEVVASAHVDGFSRKKYDVVLSNPPYFAYSAITRLFIERGLKLLSTGGRFYLVSRQPHEASAVLLEFVEECNQIENRGYTIFEVES